MNTDVVSQGIPQTGSVHLTHSLGASTATCDVIRIKDITVVVPFTDGAQWPASQATLQPVLVSLDIAHNTRPTASTDDLAHSIHYSAVLEVMACSCSRTTFSSLEDLSDQVCKTCFDSYPHLERMSVRIRRPKALLHASATGIDSDRARKTHGRWRDRFLIQNLQCQTIIGVNDCERLEKQRVEFDISLNRLRRGDVPFDFRGLAQVVLKHVQNSSYLTLEALASSVAHTTLLHCGNDSDSVTVRAAKPSAVPLAAAAEVEITRTPDDYKPDVPAPDVSATALPSPSLSSLLASLRNEPGTKEHRTYSHRAAIALGANLGDRFANIELALRLLEAPARDGSGTPRAVVVDTSFMYETAPMYVTDQPKFINCACMVETDLDPLELLQFVKDIEHTVGRVTSFRNGPRAIDLDILTFDSLVMDTRPGWKRANLDNLAGQLVVPHPRIAEREFVLRPLNDMVPDFVHPTSGKSIETLLTDLLESYPPDADPMYKVMPFPQYPLTKSPDSRPTSPSLSDVPSVPSTAKYWKFPASHSRGPRKTYIMGTLNATPDSFSDGSAHNTIPAALSYTTSSVAGGADIIDIGGYSTRPRADHVSPEEELSRVVPVIQAIRNAASDSASENPPETHIANVLISIDTFRVDVASAAVLAGANCINDVYAFTGPEYPMTAASAEHFLAMREVVRNLAVPVVLMHSRGEASANKDYSAYSYAADKNGRGAVLEGVRLELGEKVEAAVKGPGGLRRWFVLVDPGIGFSKTVEGNLELLRDAAALTSEMRPSQMYESRCASRRNPLAGFPQLIGTSRKSFLGTILASPDPDGTYAGRETRPDERGWATAAAVSCAVQQKAAVVRVHDVLQLGDVVRIGSALWA